MTVQIRSDSKPDKLNALQQIRADLSWQVVAFYLLIPLVLGGYGAINNWRLIESIGFLWAVAFYLSHAFPPWFSTCLLTSLAMHLLQPWRPRPIIIMLTGHSMSCLITLPYISWLISIFAAHWPDSGMEVQSTNLLAVDYWGYWLRAGAVWLGTNLVFDRFLELPRYRYGTVNPGETREPATGDPALFTAGTGRPAFLDRVPAGVALADVVAVKAEQHYIKIVSTTRNYLVLHRFSDALCELPANEGLQIHRSWWVRRNAIRRVRQSSRKMVVILLTGISSPVSGPYQAVVRQFARATELPVTPLTG
jgi:hypothetical protein